MKTQHRWLLGMTMTTLCATLATGINAATVGYVGTQYDIGGTFFPSYSFPQNSIVPWRSDSASNVYSVDSSSPNRYYGRDGYALFATQFAFPNANPGGVSNANVPIGGDATFKNLLDLPSWVTGSEVIATRIAGGFAYALIDDPQMQAGIRLWTFDGTDYPQPDGTNTTGVVPYVKLGVITGDALNGRVDPGGNRDRWAFTVGDGVPSQFRLGIMTDGMDNSTFAATELWIRKDGDNSTWTSTGALTAGNRFVDMSFFDVQGAQSGDTYIVSVSNGAPRLSGFSFDVVVPEPAGMALFALALGIYGGGGRIRRRN